MVLSAAACGPAERPRAMTEGDSSRAGGHVEHGGRVGHGDVIDHLVPPPAVLAG